MGPASTSPSGGTAAGMSTSSPGSEESIEGTGNSLDTVLEMKKIEFRGGNRWIVLQDLNGPCSLIRICNFLILSGQLTLDGPTVTLRVILDSVYQMVFENMKLATGLEIDINHKGIDYFGVSDSYRIFQMLGIPVYHAWVLDPKEDGPFLEVIDRRSNNELDLAAEDQYYDLLNSFRARTSSQITENGFYQLQSDPNVPYMFMLFYNSHFSLMCKSNGSLFQLQSDVGFSLNNDNMWLRVENLHWGGNFVRSPFTRCDVQRSASRSKCLESDNTYPYHCNQRNSHHKQFDRNKPRWKPTDQPTRPSNIISNVIAGSSFNSSSAPTSEDVKAQFVEFCSLQGDRDVETQFLDFLRGFTVEGKEGKHYYKAVVALMKELGIPEMRVHYKDILSFDRDLASKLCNCFTRVKKNLNNAARIFIEDFKADLKFHCENPVVYICDMPQPDGWICLKDFFALPGNRPVEKSEVSCGDFSMKEPKTTAVGRIVLRNLFDTMTTAFQDGMSWDGKWSISDVKVNNKLDVWIPVSYCPKTTRHTLQNDLLRVLSDVIPEYMLDDELPALFMHLVRSLREFSMIRPYGSAMLKKFSKFIVAHPSLKSALANMSFIDDIYISFQALSPRARLLLHFILESDGSLVDWTKMFKSKNGQGPPPTTPRYMSSVWDYAKAKKSIGKSGGDADAKKTVEGGVADTHEGDQQGVMHAGNPGGAASKSGGDADGKETVEGGVADVHEGDKQGVVRAGNPGGADNVEVEPFVSDLKDGVVFLRHLKQHGPQVTKVNAVQHFKNLSELHQVNSRFLVDLLPEVVRNLTYFSGRHPEFDQKTHDEVFGWINEILD